MTDRTDLEAVRRVLRARRPALVATYDAVGTGIGRRGRDYHITVYLKDAAAVPSEPAAVDGIAVQFEVTGPIRPHVHPGGGAGP